MGHRYVGHIYRLKPEFCQANTYLLNQYRLPMHHSELKTALGLSKPTGPMPKDFTLSWTPVGGVYVCVEAANGGKHRVRAECPECGRNVPAGRLRQHMLGHPTMRQPRG